MKLILFFLLFIPSLIFAQGNFNIEWEGPANYFFSAITNFEQNNNIPEIVLNAGTTAKVYDGATKQLKYTYTNPDTSSFLNITLGAQPPFDFNSDGINDVILYNIDYVGSNYQTTIRIINSVNGSVAYQNVFTGYYTFSVVDIDGDGYLEFCMCNYSIGSSTFKILSTPAHTIGVSENIENLKDYKLKQNYPNPFNPTTNIEYSIKENGNVKILVFDILGREIRTVLNEFKKAGTYSLMFDGSALPSGTYFYQLIVNDIPETKKMLMLK